MQFLVWTRGKGMLKKAWGVGTALENINVKGTAPVLPTARIFTGSP